MDDSRRDELRDGPSGVPPEDPIIEEVRAAREALLAAAGYDVAELARRLRADQARSGHPVVALPPKPASDSAA